MTKKFKSYVLSALAVAAIAFTGCSKNDTGMKEIEKTDFSVTLNGVNTKTTNDGMKTLWAANDAINLFHNVAGEDTPAYVSDGQFKTSAAGATATFTGTLDASFDETKTYNWYAFYPYTKQITTPANTSAGYVTVGSTAKGNQTQKGNNSTAHISGNNYPIAGVASKISGDERPVIQMRHLSSLIEVEVENATKKGEAITVSGISITADGVDIVGTYYIDFTDPYNPGFTPSGETYVSNVANLVVNSGEAIAAGEKATFYLAVKPFVVNEGDDFTITVTASNGAQEKVISADKDYEFKAGKMKKIAFAYDKTLETFDFTTVAELNELADEVGETPTSKTGKLTNAVVSFVPNTTVAIITDGTGSVMYYKSGHGLKQGQTYTGNITVTLQNYQSLYSEITTMDATFTGEGAVVDPQVLTIFNMGWQYNTYQNTYAKLENVEVTAVDGKNVTVTDGEYTGFIVYCNYGTPTCVVGDKITVIGTVTQFKKDDTVFKELKVWKADDLTITEHTPTEHAINFTQPEAGGSIKVTVGGTEITSGAKYIEGTEVKAEIVLTGGYNFTTWSITNAVNLSSTTSHVVTFKVGTADINIVANLESSSVLTETFDLSTGYSNAQEVKTVTGTNATVTFDKGTNSNTPKYYTTGTAVRVYGGGYFTVTANDSSKKISMIELTFGSGDGSNAISTDVVTYNNSTGVWTGSSSAVTFTVTGTTGHRRIKGIKVTFE
ncbi:MAG: hypothetical protein J6X91_05845 [Bacteroidales bacterium]|nr:hypothetical protein [Bacteroidales bacterium]